MERSAAVEFFWKWHPRVYRWTGGRVGGKLANLPVLLLRSKGRKTGVIRESGLTYLPWGDDFVVIASVLGEPKNPGWYHNLLATPDVEVQVGAENVAVRAEEAEGEERERIWTALIAESPDYSNYKDRAGRRIPVMLLRRST
ncbi:MAG: nitroreductase/quinone reductase family protein [Myxococcota bacterium]